MQKSIAAIGGSRFLPPSLLVFALLHTAFFGIRFLQGGTGWAAEEELQAPTVTALLLVEPRFSHLPQLQYMPFCGGCTAETLLALPLFTLLGGGLWVWKLVPLAFGLGILGVGFHLGRKIGGESGAVATAAALLAGPSWWTQGEMFGFGSHFEVGLGVLITLVLWGRLLERGTPGWALGWGWVGAGTFWFAYSGGFALPVLFGLWVLCRPRHLISVRFPVWICGVALGLLPWLLTQHALSSPVRGGTLPLLSVYGKSVTRLVHLDGETLAARCSELLGPVQWFSAFQPLFPERPVPGFVLTLTLLLGVGSTAWMAFRPSRSSSGPPSGRTRPPYEGALILLLLAFAASYSLLSPLPISWDDLGRPPNAMRYQLPAYPLVALCFGRMVGALWAGSARARGVAAVMMLLGPGTGVILRLAEVRPEALSLRPLFMNALDLQGAVPRMEASLPLLPRTPAGVAALAARVKAMARHPEGQRTFLFAFGYHRMADALADPGRPDLLQAVLKMGGSLGEEEQRWLWAGTANGLAGKGGWMDGDLLAGLPSNWIPVMEVGSPAMVKGLGREFLRSAGAPAVVGVRGEALLGGNPFLPDKRPGVPESYRLLLAWAAGRSISLGTEDPPHSLALPPSLAGSIRDAWMEGLGEALGERWGYSSSLRDSLLHRVPPSDRLALEKGMRTGTSLVFRRSSF